MGVVYWVGLGPVLTGAGVGGTAAWTGRALKGSPKSPQTLFALCCKEQVSARLCSSRLQSRKGAEKKKKGEKRAYILQSHNRSKPLTAMLAIVFESIGRARRPRTDFSLDMMGVCRLVIKAPEAKGAV